MNCSVSMAMRRGRSGLRIMRVMRSMLGVWRSRSTIVSKESHEPQPEHVEGGDKGGNQSYQPVHPVRFVRPPQYFVLAEKACQGWNSGDGKRSHRHRPECPRNLLAQAPHFAHVLLAADRVNHGTSRQEQ